MNSHHFSDNISSVSLAPMSATTVFRLPPPLFCSSKFTTLATIPSLHLIPTTTTFSFSSLRTKPNPFLTPRPDFRVWADDDGGGADDYDMDEYDDEEADELDNKKDYEVEYDTLAMTAALRADDEIALGHSKSFMSTQGWDSEMIVDYRINEDEFHKIQLLDCDFFIRKPPDPDNDVFDFSEMYVTPPDTDIYSIPSVLAPMPQKFIRCAKSDYRRYNVKEPPIDALRDPMYTTEKEILKCFLTRHFKNRRLGDSEFVLDFEEIYVIDSKTRSITRARVVVTVPEGRDRDRKKDLLVVRDNGDSFQIIPISEKEDPTLVVQKEEWKTTRRDMERHLRKLRDFNVSNWF